MMKLLRIILFVLPLLIAAPVFAEEAAHGEHHDGPPHLPNFVQMIWGDNEVVNHWVEIIFAAMIAIFFTIIASKVYANRKLIPGPFQNAIEMLVEGMYNFLHSILGSEAKRYTPFLGTLFFYILTMNFFGIIPFFHSPSVNVNVTASLAIMVFCYVQYTGITRLGIKGYIHHMAGSPHDITGWVLVPLLFPLHLFGEFVKPASLALRLFGNITGEDILVAAFVGLGLTTLSFMHSPIGLPLNVPFILLGILMSSIQALVFTLLSTIYILMMLPHGEEHH